ncbi:MAG: hypothetical protein DYG83_02805 [Candidatus Brocadia sp. AMX2]|uniref:Uncharacterized protein n=1 Tax=Candidatus Brocadia sinica JPN1 TaxID=1197129 RepID=A0ABQ0JX61_9BACT|nr:MULTISPECIES: hypothetical protein [Brocadia]MBC6931081.1 hypothetical protein [Candidatus Brocadia sp.]MBL1168142.1 hypothetical protein [Candidatus Brocadia sp. AMX1]MCK6469182.1 hypothetical protein [Candidatus Brocadia sinica]NOG40914.1 hypothetical protein [Planctomycetota bacterium]KAA0241651.1 MAG: hypothetical protein EDM70_17295 [Candidatus Brocadia sp. AMX2]
MQSVKQYTTNSYLHDILNDGVKPFRYRNGVRSLLGIPDNDNGNLAFSPTIPLAGFVYENYQYRGEPSMTDRKFSHENARAVLHGKQWIKSGDYQRIIHKNIHQNSPCDGTDATDASKNTPCDLPGKKISNDTLLVDIARKADVSPESTVEKASPDGLFGHSYEIDNEMQTHLSNGIEREQCKTVKQETTQNPPFIKYSVPQKSPIPESKDEKAFTAQAKKSENIATDIERASIEIPDTPGKKGYFPGPSPITRQNPLPGKEEVSSFFQIVKEKKNTFHSHRIPGTSHSIVTGTINEPNRNAYNRIEQLRQAVHELTSKKSVQQERPDNETRPQEAEKTLPPLAQRTVVIKQPPNRIRTHCAFWERRYLGRFHLRILR